MQNNEKEYFIYLRTIKEKVSVTKKQFDDYYRGINAYRRTKQNHGQCICPASKRLLCTMDCLTCPYHTSGNTISLDESLFDDNGNEISRFDYLQIKDSNLKSSSLEDIISDSDELQRLLHRLSELMPEAIEIGSLRQQGLSDKAIAEKTGIARTTFLSRLKKAKKTLKKEFPNIF